MTDDPKDLTNGDLARIFHEIGDILEVKGELVFKTVAYHRAADAIGRNPVDLVAAYRAGERPAVPGVGKAISDKIEELATTGHMAYYDQLRAEIPPGLVELLQIPGLGPKTVRQLHLELKIASMDDLRQAAEAGRLRDLRGMSAKTETLVLEGIARLDSTPDRMLLDKAEEWLTGLIGALGDTAGVQALEPAGSFRRRRETIGDLDLLAETDDAVTLIERFTALGSVDHVVNKGGYKAAVRLQRGPQVDLMIMRPGEAGTYRDPLHRVQGPQHPVARDGPRPGLVALGEGVPAHRRGWRAADRRRRRAQDVRDRDGGLRLPRPAVHRTRTARGRRRDRGGPGGSPAGTGDPRGPAGRPAHALRLDRRHARHRRHGRGRPRRGYAYQVLTDHTQSLAIARGLTPDQVAEQREIVAGLNARFAAEEAAGTAPPETPADGFRLLHGCELEIRADGALDYEDDLLASYDLVVASLHVSRRQSRAELTRRTLNAIRSPHVDVIAHPAGRMLGGRDDLDLDWDQVYTEAGAHRHGPRDQRVAAPTGPRGRTRPARGRRGLRRLDRLGRPQDERARLRSLGDQPGAPGMGQRRGRAQHA